MRARDAQDTWGHTPLAERVKCLLGAAREMLQRRQEVMQLVEQEIGKVHAEALFTEALGPLDAVKGWASVLRPALARRKVRLNPLGFPGKRAQVEAVPR
ncbi:MAG: aldehyde dehydrogenase family protein, partial [Myxococcaceae bacterium]